MNSNNQVFISHSAEDRQIAVALCNYLESGNICCWMAPRNIHVGKDYAQSIMEAIESSAIMILILSDASNNSKHVRNEIERAFNHQLVIMPFRVKNIVPSRSLEYFLSSTHWLDGYSGKPEKYFEILFKNCNAILNISETHEDKIANKPVLQEKAKPKLPQTKKIIYGIAAFACIIAAFVFLKTGNSNKSKNDVTQTVKTDSSALQKKDNSTVKKDTPNITVNSLSSKKINSLRKQVSTAEVSENKNQTAIPVSPTIADLIIGKYYKPDGADELTFNLSGNNIISFSGRIGGKSIPVSELNFTGNAGFRIVSFAISGTLHFSNNYENVVGEIRCKNISYPLTVDLVKTNNDY